MNLSWVQRSTRETVFTAATAGRRPSRRDGRGWPAVPSVAVGAPVIFTHAAANAVPGSGGRARKILPRGAEWQPAARPFPGPIRIPRKDPDHATRQGSGERPSSPLPCPAAHPASGRDRRLETHRFPRSRSGRTVLEIAHQVGAIGMLPCAPDTFRRFASSSKKRGWPPAALQSLCRSRQPQGSCLVDRRAMPPLTPARPRSVGNGTRKLC